MLPRLLAALLVAALASVLSAAGIAVAEVRRGYLCRDVHKPGEVYVPCSAGLSIAVAALAGFGTAWLLGLTSLSRFLAASLSIAVAAVIGLLDDLKGLSPRTKILLGLAPAIPVIALHQYVPRPWIPVLGHARMFIVYPLLVLAAYTVFCNGANMIDTHNGVLAWGATVVTACATALAIGLGAPMQNAVTLAIALAILAPYTILNTYPARVFNGNAGSFAIGAVLATSAVTCRMEALYVLANMVLFLNGLLYLASAGGFLQKERVDRPTVVEPNGVLKPSCNPRAPITIVRLALATMGSASEKKLVTAIIATYAVNAAIATALITLLGYKP